jgi:cell wall-associated NlpC family hydrolase
VDAVRGDLADVRLAERIFAPHYAAFILRSAVVAAPIHASTKAGGTVLSEILPGEGFEVLELASEYAWGKSQGDGTVGFVPVAALGDVDPAVPAPAAKGDPVALAETLLGAPSRPGGRSPAGFDATGLIQYVLSATGHAAPRFGDLQAETLGAPVSGTPARGDLIFFADHAAIMIDAENAIHVGDAVAREPLDAIVARFGPITSARRL